MQKIIRFAAVITIVGTATAAEPLYVPTDAPRTAQVESYPELPSFEGTHVTEYAPAPNINPEAYGNLIPAQPHSIGGHTHEEEFVTEPFVIQQGPPVHGGFYEGAFASSTGVPAALYPNVKVRDVRRIHPDAVTKVVSVRNPCDPSSCVLVEICVPPCKCERVRIRRNGNFVHYDYGRFAVDVVSRPDGLIMIDYDGRLARLRG